MRRLRKMRRPSTSMIVACLALVLATGGTAVAVVGLNGKQKKQVKKISKNQANKRIRALAPGLSVLHAKTADTANTATRATSAAAVDQLKTGGFKLVASSASASDPGSARAAASEVPLFSIGAFDVYGKCFVDTTASATFAETYIRTRVNGSILESNVDLFSGDPTFLDTGTAEDARQLSQRSQATGSAGIDADDNGTFGAAAPDGTAITGQVAAAVKRGTLSGGDGIYGAGDKCVFWGHLIG